MAILNCPLCCNETFESTTLLKCHIEDILEKIICPLCNEKFHKLTELVQHLETCSEKKQIEKEENDDEDSQYYCQVCRFYFNEIDDHLSKYHRGQEIILEEEGKEEPPEDEEEETVYVITQEEDETASTAPQSFTDKDGRLYTRKFVKIDKFWLEQDPPLKITPQNGLIEIGQCQKCKMYFSINESEHRCDDPNDKYECKQCPSTFDHPDLLENHTKTHNNPTKKNPEGPYHCHHCNTTFPTFKSLRLHKRMHDPVKTREIEAPSKLGLTQEEDDTSDDIRHMFICSICNKTYDKQYESIHMEAHNTEGNGLNCKICNRKFYNQSSLEMHLKAHSNNKKFTCSYCKKPFVTYDALNDHLTNQCQQRLYACQFCGRRFARPHEKVKHERIHTGEKPYVCDICGKAFRVSYCLTLHLRTHSGTRPYQCKDCGKRFKSHSVFNHHLLIHSDVRAYKCPFCPKAFKTSVQLAGHKNSHIKPFTCTECNRPFASLYAVRSHMETHKRDNNLKYECWMCGALYSRVFALRDHLKQHHKNVEGNKAKAVALNVEDEEIDAANSILVTTEDNMILGIDGNIEIIENE